MFTEASGGVGLYRKCVNDQVATVPAASAVTLASLLSGAVINPKTKRLRLQNISDTTIEFMNTSATPTTANMFKLTTGASTSIDLPAADLANLKVYCAAEKKLAVAQDM